MGESTVKAGEQARDGAAAAPEADRDLRAIYIGALVLEAIVITAIWLFGRYFQ